MMYYMRPGEEEERENMRRQAKKIGAALTGRKTPPTEAAVEKQKRKALNEYYRNCAFPKPQDVKQKKKVNGYKDKPKRVCYYCKTNGAERHEVYPGRGKRQICIDNGFQVDLCQNCHREMHRNATLQAKERNKFWKEKYQREYEGKLIATGVTPEQARELWLKLIGRSYL